MQNIFKMEEIMHNQLTESDIKKMQEEIEYRKLVVRKEALEDVKEARAQGDLSENFEYYAAKKFKNKNEGRIRSDDASARARSPVVRSRSAALHTASGLAPCRPNPTANCQLPALYSGPRSVRWPVSVRGSQNSHRVPGTAGDAWPGPTSDGPDWSGAITGSVHPAVATATAVKSATRRKRRDMA